MSEPALDLIPTEIVEAYYPDGITRQAAITGGEVNTTLLVIDTNGEKTILQRLSSIYDASVSDDYEVVAAHLRGKGWEMATTLKASDGTSYLPDSSGRLWRAFNYIESTPGSGLEGDLEACAALGGLLGALHRSLAALDYQPKFSRPHAQDADYHSNRLEVLMPQIPDPINRELAGKMIALSREVTISSEPTQLIHSDPRIGNTLLRSGKPFTFIDWDGFKIANPLVDVGDMLQSTAGEVITKGMGNCSVEQLYPMLEAYYAQTGLSTGRQAFIEKAVAAGRVIALNLGMRHLIDSVEDSYFVWNTDKFKSRLEFNLFCARRQRQVYKIFEA